MIETLNRESILPVSEAHWLGLRTKDLTSTESAILFGLSPYGTPFELWHRKKDQALVNLDPNERMDWGNRLQDPIAAGVAKDQGWTVSAREVYERLPDHRIGASYDFTIIGAVMPGKDGLLEIKNVDGLVYRNEWVENGEEIEAPPHIELQVQHQMLVSGLSYAYIAALVGGNSVTLIRRKASPEICFSILKKAEQFWESIDRNEPPKPDFARDADFISTLYRNVKEGEEIDLSQDPEVKRLALEYKACGKRESEAKADKAALKAQLLIKIGTAERATGNGFSISAKTVAATPIKASVRKSYRGFTVNVKKEKKS